MRQLCLYQPRAAEGRWVTGRLPDRTGLSRYTILIRSAADPERSPRPVGGQEDRAPHRTLSRTRPEEWHELILRLVEVHGPITFNGASVLLLDKTADITCDTPFEAAFWQLVEKRHLAFTMEAPVLFRRWPECTLPLSS